MDIFCPQNLAEKMMKLAMCRKAKNMLLFHLLHSASSYAREEQCVLPPSGQTDLVLSNPHIWAGNSQMRCACA